MLNLTGFRRLFKGLDVVDAPPAGAVRARMHIGGRWEHGTGRDWLRVASPATGEDLGYLPLGARADAERAIGAAVAAAPKLAGLTVWQRAGLCQAIAARIEARGAEIARMVCLEQGKTITEARGEAAAAAAAFRNAGEQIKWLETAAFPVEDGAKRAMSILQPKGAFGVITPWNFPVALPCIYYLGPGIATGNALVWTPAPTTSLAAALVMECMIEAGVPEGAVNLVTGEGPVVGDALVMSERLQGIAFTGSSAVGDSIAKRAAGKAQLLELGGNGPSVVLEDADLDRAADCISRGAFSNAGQICTATERVLVHVSVHDALVGKVLEKAADYVPGLSTEESSRVGALNNEENACKVDAHLAEAVAGGATIRMGGGRAAGMPTPLYYRPTVITGVPPESALHLDETFGPVVPILAFEDEDDLFRLAGLSPMGLSAALFTRDLSRAFRLAERLRCGSVNVNEASSYWEMHMPAGGAAGTRSGHGRTGGRHTLLAMSDLKTITFHVGG
ncbi:aldehyde dehydrogenase [Mangrovicoccus sp. HB161399]|uniref:aldehyde dehydrogenase family protein n=1 Tax=Mangrovicoccus sp. HB161399 TaxID=2720392 RepID=UPI0020A68F65|nr:aldehyde dehydrogenase family protein [Mangrovicoccus sp. HB161399]